MQIREFNVSGADPEFLVISPNHLGSTFETDNVERCETLSKELGTMVVGYERAGTGQSPSGPYLSKNSTAKNYLDTARLTGEAIEEQLAKHGLENIPRILIGNSAAATEAVLVAHGQTLKIDSLIVADPTGLQNKNRRKFQLDYLIYLRKEDSHKKVITSERTNFFQRMKEAKDRIAEIKDPVTVDSELYTGLWSGDVLRNVLDELATEPKFYSIASYIGFAAHTFASSAEDNKALAERLDDRRPPIAMPFRAEFLPSAWHGHFTKPEDLAAFTRRALSKLELA